MFTAETGHVMDMFPFCSKVKFPNTIFSVWMVGFDSFLQ